MTFPQAPENQTIARLMDPIGKSLIEGETLPSYWRPLVWSRNNEDDAPIIVLSSFSSYAPTSPVPPQTGDCLIPQEAFSPKEFPEGYSYVGYHVIVNFVFDEDRSSAITDYVPGKNDLIDMVSKTTISDLTTECDWIVQHIFIPKSEGDTIICGPTRDQMTPPATPSGFRYAGYDVMINYQLTDSTVDLRRSEKPTDINHIKGATSVINAGLQCDVVVRHLFEKIIPGAPPPPQPPKITDDFQIVGNDSVEFTKVESGYPPPSSPPAPDVPRIVKHSLLGTVPRSSDPVHRGTIIALWIDYELAQGEPIAVFLQSVGADGYATVTGFTATNWGELGSVNLFLDIQSEDPDAWVGQHLLRVALAADGDEANWDNISNYLLIPLHILQDAQP